MMMNLECGPRLTDSLRKSDLLSVKGDEMTELTDSALNRQLAEALGWRVVECSTPHEYQRGTHKLLNPKGEFSAIAPSEMDAWRYAPRYCTDIAAALWAFREANERCPGAATWALYCAYDQGEQGHYGWLLLDGTERKLAKAALKALQAQKGASDE